jgi:uncharacterized protein YbjT (DUF2867 family)
VDAAVAAGHEVVAFVRDPAVLAPRAGVTAVAGDVRDAGDLATAMDGADAVVSTLGIGRSRKPDSLILDSTRAIVEAAERTGVRRVVIMSAFGVGASLPKASWIARLIYNSGGKATFADKAAGEQLLTASRLEWALAYPVLLTTGPASGRLHAIDLDELDRLPGMPRISRADVVPFLLDAAVTGAWARRTAVLTTATR